jgi:5-methylcytosine-specific restriction endonuclease McrA
MNKTIKTRTKNKIAKIVSNKRKIRRFLFNRDGTGCFYCNTRLNFETATIDHLIPKSQGGSDNLDNLVLACHECNIGKGAKSLNEFIGSKLKVVV